MASTNSEPLGFSDLNQDEELLVLMYRDWKRAGRKRAIIEHSIARNLRQTKMYDFLVLIFSTFQATIDLAREKEEGALLLTADEEELLTQVALTFEQLAPFDARLQEMSVRPAENILRSGKDRVFGEVNRTYWQVAALGARGKPTIH